MTQLIVPSESADKSMPNRETEEAIKDAAEGDTIWCGSFENYKKLVENLDDD